MQIAARMLTSFVFLSVAVSVSPAAKAVSFSEGEWAGASYKDDSGQFSGCTANAPYNSGMDLFVTISRTYQWALGVHNPRWKVTPGSKHDLSMRIDGGPWLSTPAIALDPDLVEIPLPLDSTLINLFRRGHLMEMRGERFSGSFELTGTAKMIGKLVSCVDTVLGVKDLPKTSPGAPTTSAEAGNESQPPSGPGREGGATNKSIYTGTGIVVTANGDVLTNNHVVKDCPNSIAVRRQDNTPTSAEVLFKDPENDLALLKISIERPLENTQVATIRLSPAIRAGEAIAVYGYPLAGTLSTSGNIVPGNVSALSGMGDDARYFQITAPIQAGNSGGPLLDMTGSVAGVVNSKLDEMKFSAEAGTFPQNVNFAIKANIATNFLDAHSIPYKVAPQDTAALELPGVADKARNFTVLIVCD